jgi:hypothetical protein
LGESLNVDESALGGCMAAQSLQNDATYSDLVNPEISLLWKNEMANLSDGVTLRTI